MADTKRENGIPEKKLALYKAVLQLLEEDADIHTLKVQDITAKAGIGKGTAYEYFSSKEEMIAKAVLWYKDRTLEAIFKRVAGEGKFSDKLLGIFETIEEQRIHQKCSSLLFQMKNQPMEVVAGIREEFLKNAECNKKVEELFDFIVEEGKKESAIREELTSQKVYMVLIPAYMSFFMYLNAPEKEKFGSVEEIKEFLLGNILLVLK